MMRDITQWRYMIMSNWYRVEVVNKVGCVHVDGVVDKCPTELWRLMGMSFSQLKYWAESNEANISLMFEEEFDESKIEMSELKGLWK